MLLHFGRRSLVAGAGSLATLRAARGAARQVRIGVLTDLSGPYADAGEGSVTAARLALEDYAKINPALAVEIVNGDMQGKPDLGISIARRWLDRDGVDAIADVPQSALALAVAPLLRERDKVGLFNGPISSDLTGTACTPNTVQWTYDTYSLGNSMAKALLDDGLKTWFFVTADYAAGHAMANDTAAAVRRGGGTVLGEVAHPFPGTTDFASLLMQAQVSNAQVIAFANAGSDLINCIKQAAEFGITQGGKQRLAAIDMVLSSVDGIGLPTAQGTVLADPFYWDMNDGTRAWAKRYQAINPRGAMPLSPAAGCYSVIIHFLKAVDALGEIGSGRAVVEKMKTIPTEDPLFGRNTLRADGRLMNTMYLFRVKAPAESRGRWDYYQQLRAIPAEQAYRPLANGGCPLVKS